MPSCRLVRSVNVKKAEKEPGPKKEFCHHRKPLPNRLQCSNRIERREVVGQRLLAVMNGDHGQIIRWWLLELIITIGLHQFPLVDRRPLAGDTCGGFSSSPRCVKIF